MTLLKPLQVNGLTSVAHGPDEPTNPQHETPAGVSPVRSFAGHSAIAVEDIDRSIAFYAALGFEALWRDPDWAFLRSPGGWGVALLVRQYSPIAASVPPLAVVAALGASAVTGVLFGMLPAARASRLDPVDALRYE